MGIEPTSEAWEAPLLGPLNYTFARDGPHGDTALGFLHVVLHNRNPTQPNYCDLSHSSARYLIENKWSRERRKVSKPDALSN